MLFVFHVDTGTMMTFDMSLALQSVHNLKQFVEDQCKIPVDKQVLLISGGECLDPTARVCSYPAGTDTNPIYLFSKAVIESVNPPLPNVDYGSDFDLKDKVKEASELPATYQTVVKRAQLAQQFHEVAREQTRICEKLVHDQHLQQQGWSAVVANLEDITAEFRKRAETFDKNVSDYMAERDTYITFLKGFHEDLVILQKIPILSVLLETEKKNAIELESSKTSEENSSTNQDSESVQSESKELTLLQWISAADNKNSMDQMYEHCLRGIEQFDERVFKELKEEVNVVLNTADNQQMKEVKGLGDRLSGLETLMREAKKHVQEQFDLAQSFLKNQNRASNLKDPSILPDLCASHRKQLQVIASNHQQLCDIRRRCTKAKEELSVNLYHRLKWVMYIENEIVEIDQKLMIYHENLRRLRRLLEVLQQIHMAPATYLCAVAEVVRRRAFSQSFLLWASELACHLLTMHNEEVTRRKDFQAQFEGHFLNSLFPGMEDLPPSFATQPPSLFDSSLPKITQEDVDRLKEELPDLADNLNVPDTSAVTNFFMMKSIMKGESDKVDDSKAVEEKLVQVVKEVGLDSNLDQNLLRATGSEPCLTTAHGLPHLKDLDRGCESETDTEEFEKVGQSPLELHFDKEIPSPRPGTQDASTLTEDNLQISRSEHEKLKSYLAKMGYLARQATLQLKSELNDLKKKFITDREILEQNYKSFNSFVENVLVEKDNKGRELVESIIKKHELQIEEFVKTGEAKSDEIKSLQETNACLEDKLSNISLETKNLQEEIQKINESNSKQLDELHKKLQEKEVEKEKCVKEITDRLSREHKAEVENIRSRFKLMTMERSPSDTSLEKIGDFSSIPNHETILLQMTETFELDKEKAVNEAITKENEKWQKILEERLKEMEDKFRFEKENIIQDVAKRVSEEKDKQIDVLREREKNLNLECIKYKSTIQQLAENEAESHSRELLDKIDLLQKEKETLEEELVKMKNLRDLTTSVAVLEGKVDVSTSPIRQIEGHPKPETSSASPVVTKSTKLCIETCKAGDTVLVLWDSVHESFKILQESKYMFFLHTESLASLHLEVTNGKPNKPYCTGEVVDKEYCHARKPENRYKVPKGTKFFRVKVKPFTTTSSSTSSSQKDMSQSCYHPKTAMLLQSHMSQSQSCVPTYSEVVREAIPSRSLPSSPTKSQSTIVEAEEERTVPDNPVELRPLADDNKTFGDSGIVDDPAVVAVENIDKSLTSSGQDNLKSESESSDRYDDVSSMKLTEQQSFVSSNWLEMMFSRVFAKNQKL